MLEIYDLIEHMRRSFIFSQKTYGPGLRTNGLIDHIEKELKEIKKKPHDLMEWIDIIILGIDGATRCAYDQKLPPQAVARALQQKQMINESREWPDWQTAPKDKAIEHVRKGD